MLDENLPAFFLKPSSTGVKHHNEFYLSYHGSDPEPAYHLRHADPASPSPAHKNCYAAAIFDAYNPEVLYGEVLARPEWTQTKADTQGGIPPPPQPILPSEFAVQLYNPEQQVKVEVKSSMFGADSYEFSMPQDVFRTPSGSSIDKGASDPASLDITPRINFIWRKDGRLNKDLTCFMTGKSTDTKKRSNRKDPDISIALWRNMRELTMYEPNLTRVDMEDPKGLEVVLLLTAVVIKDLYFGSKDQLPELFNISDASGQRRSSGGGRKLSSPKSANNVAGAPVPLSQGPVQPPGPMGNDGVRNSLPRLQTTPSSSNPPPMADPRAQWELDNETARLKAQADAERAEAERRRREQHKKDEAERKRLLKMVEEEEKTARKRQVEIDKETERLRKLYGVQPIPQYQQQPPQPGGSNYNARQIHSRPYLQPGPSFGSNGMPIQPSASVTSFMPGAIGPGSNLGPPANQPKKKRSFFM